MRKHYASYIIMIVAFEDKPRMDYVVSLTVRYKSIRRIFVALRPVDEGQRFWLELYFHLQCPVVIRRIKLFAPDPSKPHHSLPPNLLTKFGDRYTSWNPSKVGDGRRLENEINQSPIFKIVLRDISVSF